jgi:hypothetical protein
VPLCPPKIPHRLAWVEPGPPQWNGPGYMKIGQYYLTRNVMIYTGHLLSLKAAILYEGQSVNHWPLIAETCLHSQGRPCGIYGRQNGTEIYCTPSVFGLPLSVFTLHQSFIFLHMSTRGLTLAPINVLLLHPKDC